METLQSRFQVIKEGKERHEGKLENEKDKVNDGTNGRGGQVCNSVTLRDFPKACSCSEPYGGEVNARENSDLKDKSLIFACNWLKGLY